MTVFEYKGTDAAGQPVSGSLASISIGAAADELAKRGYTVENLSASAQAGDPLQVNPVFSPDPPASRNVVQTHLLGAFDKVPLSDLGFFFRQLSTMLHAGVGMVQTLETIANQTSDHKLKSILRECRDGALEGRPLSQGMDRYPDVFAPLMISLVKTGEKAGMLDQTLKHISEYIEREIKLRNMIRMATLYPKVVVGASIFIIGVTNVIIGTIGGQGIWSPLTQLSTWLCIAPWIIGLFIFVKFILPDPNMKQRWDQFWLGVPYFGTTMKQFALAKFSRAFACLYRGGVSPQESALLSADACGNLHMRARLRPAAPMLEEGRGLTEVYAYTGVVDPVVLNMIHTGETTGDLDNMLERVATFYEEDSEVRAKVMATVAGVVALVCVGIYVAIVVIKFYVGHFSGLGAAAGD
ncbi:MAG: type II secretion system F family protein [Fimbriimonadaceae bacterium]